MLRQEGSRLEVSNVCVHMHSKILFILICKGSSLHNIMTPHGPDGETCKKATAADLKVRICYYIQQDQFLILHTYISPISSTQALRSCLRRATLFESRRVHQELATVILSIKSAGGISPRHLIHLLCQRKKRTPISNLVI
jgi:hypothetical protein